MGKPAHGEIEVVQGRIIGNPKDEANAFVQITVSITSRQIFAAFNKKGGIEKGDPEEIVTVNDIWVLERSLKKGGPDVRWRLAGRLGQK